MRLRSLFLFLAASPVLVACARPPAKGPQQSLVHIDTDSPVVVKRATPRAKVPVEEVCLSPCDRAITFEPNETFTVQGEDVYATKITLDRGGDKGTVLVRRAHNAPFFVGIALETAFIASFVTGAFFMAATVLGREAHASDEDRRNLAIASLTTHAAGLAGLPLVLLFNQKVEVLPAPRTAGARGFGFEF